MIQLELDPRKHGTLPGFQHEAWLQKGWEPLDDTLFGTGGAQPQRSGRQSSTGKPLQPALNTASHKRPSVTLQLYNHLHSEMAAAKCNIKSSHTLRNQCDILPCRIILHAGKCCLVILVVCF